MTDMKKTIPISFLIIFLSIGVAFAGDLGFETKAEGIVKRLTSPTIKFRGKMKTRGIQVVSKDENGMTSESRQIVTEKRTGNFINLAVRFDVNSSKIRPETAVMLDELGKALNHPELSGRAIKINGHTDADGPDTHNLLLSLERAGAAKKFLVKHYKIAPQRLKVFGYGEGLPLAPNTSGENKQLNRRVEILLAN
jgi:outer membrane protein OmpA-like peptidoglycan-associated protein